MTNAIPPMLRINWTITNVCPISGAPPVANTVRFVTMPPPSLKSCVTPFGPLFGVCGNRNGAAFKPAWAANRPCTSIVTPPHCSR
jgi:hypothetical protein